MPDVSPTKWHLAHVSWFFETFVVRPHLRGYAPLDERYTYLFNSYYNAVGAQFSRPDRGHLSRPTVAEVYRYRTHVDGAVGRLLDSGDDATVAAVADLVTLGLHHEQQHQELILTDIKYNLGANPLRPAYHPAVIPRAAAAEASSWRTVEGGLVEIGHDGPEFAFDNEGPRHRLFLAPYRLASRPVTNAEFMDFIDAGGYRDWQLWLSEGWRVVQERGWQAPLYWERRDGAWMTYTLSGLQPLDPHAPVTHVSYLEADAYARWRGARLPTEAEWEHAAARAAVRGHFLDAGVYHPVAADGSAQDTFAQLYGDVWEWTQSAYAP
jgi:ergothioneine biosynthesis protein EgtB